MARRLGSLPAAVLACGFAVSTSLTTASADGVPGQATRRSLNRAEQAEARELVLLTDAAMKGEAAGAEAALRWQAHFLRAPDGRTYVPFTVVLEDVDDRAFREAAMYVRAAIRGDATTGQAGKMGPAEVPPADLPVFSYDAAASHSAALRLMDRDVSTGAVYPFQDFRFARTASPGGAGPRQLQGALAVPAGNYDVYVTLRERPSSVRRGQAPRWSVVKAELAVPDLAGPNVAMSSVIAAETVKPLDRPLDASEQAGRPYALGSTEIVPSLRQSYSGADTLSVLFFVYHAASDAGGKPDVWAEYRFFRRTPDGEEPFKQAASQRFDAGALPPEFDLRAGHQLVPMHQLPLDGFPPGTYRLDVRVIDRIAPSQTSGELLFEVR